MAGVVAELVIGGFFGFVCLVWAAIFVAQVWEEAAPWLGALIQAVFELTDLQR